MTTPDALALFLLFNKALLTFVSVTFLISGIDDGFIDLYHAVRSIYRRLFVVRHPIGLNINQLTAGTEQPIAVMLPAWDESDVIRRMLETNLERIRYRNLHIFVGTYSNDPKTQREVELVRERFGNVHRLVCPSDGPTSKADCLNWIFQGILVFEKEHGVRFEIFAMNDSEDLIHPLCFKLFNCLMPRLDMIQLPVIPLEAPWWQFTAGHYLDEFAESHAKDMVVRESLTGVIPGAGVGCAFSRRALDLASRASHNELFSPRSLTEDYDFGMRLQAYGLKQAFVRVAVECADPSPDAGHGTRRPVATREYIAIREYFPVAFKAAVRQKARWIIGISFQGWRKLGWTGGLSMKYELWRDRKGLITNPAVAVGYGVVLGFLILWTLQWLDPDFYHFPTIVERGSWLWYVILANTFFLCLRVFQRCRFVGHIHGWRQAMLAAPRQVWANIVNIAAVSRAFYVFGRSLWTGRSVTWDKTAHTFPSEAVFRNLRRKLGDLLLDKQLLTVAQLDLALERQQLRGRPLGVILRELNLVTEDQVAETLAQQARLPFRLVDPYSVSLDGLRCLPRTLAIRHSIFPLADDGRCLAVAAVHPISAELRAQLESDLLRRLEICLAPESDVAFGIFRAYERLLATQPGPLLGERLMAAGLVSEGELREALRRQRRSYVRLGTLLMELDLISPEAIDNVVRSFAPDSTHLGDTLVASGRLTVEQLDFALTAQRKRFRPVGQVLVEGGVLSTEALESELARTSYAA